MHIIKLTVSLENLYVYGQATIVVGIFSHAGLFEMGRLHSHVVLSSVPWDPTKNSSLSSERSRCGPMGDIVAEYMYLIIEMAFPSVLHKKGSSTVSWIIPRR